MITKLWAVQVWILISFIPPHLALTKKATNEPVDSPLDGYTAAANFLKLGMNANADPCNNFYDFTCGNLATNLRSSDPNLTYYTTFSQVSTNFTRRIVKLLDDLKPSDTPIPSIANNVKVFWNKCLNRQESTSKANSVRDAIKFTKELGGAPLLDAKWKESDESFFTFAMEAQKRFGTNFGIGLAVGENTDGNQNVMYISLNTDIMSTSSVLEIHSKFAQLAGQSTISEDKMSEQESEMEEARTELRKKVDVSSGRGMELITLKDIYELLPDLAKSLSEQGIGNASHIYMKQSDINTVKGIIPFLSKYSRYRRAMQNFLMGTYFTKVAKHLNITDFTPLNTTHENVTSTINLDRSQDPHDYYGQQIKDLPETTQYCLETSVTAWKTGFFEHVVLRLFVEKYGPSREEALKLRELVDLVREELRVKFFNANWLDYPSKIRGLNKLTSIIPRVAYPMWIVNNTAMEAYFQVLGTFSNSDSYLKVLSKAHENKWKNKIDLVNRPIAQDYNDFGMSSFYTNAWYQRDRNAFALALGILQPAFYRPDYPKALIYGIIGAITGHEIVHGFDRGGVKYSLEGKREQWMSDESYEEFKKRSECVEDQYSKFCYNLSGAIYCVNGVRKASENIADIDGLKAAYNAYKAYVERSGGGSDSDKSLPGLETYSWDQIFFMGYGSAWCGVYPEANLIRKINYGSHSPGESRVNGTCQNMPSFAEAFNCPFGSKMNPTQKCHVW